MNSKIWKSRNLEIYGYVVLEIQKPETQKSIQPKHYKLAIIWIYNSRNLEIYRSENRNL